MTLILIRASSRPGRCASRRSGPAGGKVAVCSPRASRRESRDSAGRPNVRAVGRPSQERHADESAENGVALGLVHTPEPLCLPRRELQSGHFDEFALDPVQEWVLSFIGSSDEGASKPFISASWFEWPRAQRPATRDGFQSPRVS